MSEGGKGVKTIAEIVVLLIIGLTMISCAHYSTTAKRPETENTINAPIDIVWEKTLNILSDERITIKEANKDTYYISGVKDITFWSTSDKIFIKLIPKGNSQTIVHFEAKAAAQLIGWGHQERMVKDIFNKVKLASEKQ